METKQMKQTPIARQLVGMGLLSGALLLGALPGAAMATAWYEAGGILDLTVTAPAGVRLESAIDLDATSETLIGDGTVYTFSLPILIGDSATSQVAMASGEANPTLAGSTASSAATNSVSVTAFNDTADPLSVQVDYLYSLNAAAGLDDAVMEAVGATATVDIGRAVGQQALAAIVDLFAPGSEELNDISGSFNISLTPNGSNGVWADLGAEGLAISVADAPIPNPTPGTLALFALGLGGLAARYRRRG